MTKKYDQKFNPGVKNAVLPKYWRKSLAAVIGSVGDIDAFIDNYNKAVEKAGHIGFPTNLRSISAANPLRLKAGSNFVTEMVGMMQDKLSANFRPRPISSIKQGASCEMHPAIIMILQTQSLNQIYCYAVYSLDYWTKL